MMSKSSSLRLLTVWTCIIGNLFCYSATFEKRAILAVRKFGGDIKIVPELYNLKFTEKVVARGRYWEKYNKTGWSYLDIATSPNTKDADQAYSAGLLEGWLTADLIYSHWYNTMKQYYINHPKICNPLSCFMEKNKNWIQKRMKNKSDPYWYHVSLYYKQIDGLHAGYNAAKSEDMPALSWDDLFMLNAMNDLEDITTALNVSVSKRKVFGSGSGSALIKVLPHRNDVLVSHVSWSGYENMLKIQKKYDFNFRENHSSKQLILGNTMSFSSFPGGLQSGDNFYLISSGLVTLGTTNKMYNTSLWSDIDPESMVLGFVRTMVANRLGANPEDWINLFKLYNSGTHNSQWMIVNYGAIVTGSSLPTENLFYVVEQIPGYVEYDDLTEHLINKTYWASYNIPYFPFIFNMSGNNDMEQHYGQWFSHSNSPRARLFAKNHVKAYCSECLLDLMRSNDFKNEPESKCNCIPPYTAVNAISSRSDLNPANGTYPIEAMGHQPHGATDAKVTSIQMFHRFQFLAVSGPTQGTNKSLGPFCWSKSGFNEISHRSQPDCFDFEPVLHEWPL